jgi:hypothetical protein
MELVVMVVEVVEVVVVVVVVLIRQGGVWMWVERPWLHLEVLQGQAAAVVVVAVVQQHHCTSGMAAL